MTYEIFKENQVTLWGELRRCDAILNAYPRGTMGLTPDAVKSSPEFQRDLAAANKAFQSLRTFNKAYVSRFKKEIAADRRR